MQKKKAFTLIELVVVMALIAILATLIIAAIVAARNAAADTQRRSNAHSVQTGLEAFYARQKSYPPAAAGLTAIVDAVNAGGSNILPATGTSGALTDPAGAAGDVRYCYQPSGAGYLLGVSMGPGNDTAPSCGTNPPSGTNVEDFSVNP